jgi:predicted enzyme related to lactoylglutathione lyase
MQLNLLVLRARRPQSLVAFYERLGAVFVEERHGDGPIHHSARQGPAIFEIYPCFDENRSTRATRIGFAVSDVDDACALALSVDGELVSAPQETAWGRRAVVKDPEGHIVELVAA